MTTNQFRLFTITGILLLVGSCGKPANRLSEDPLDPLDPEPVPATEEPPTPYPNHPGQEFHGEKNFARLLNGYEKAKPDPMPWAGYWWPYKENGIATGKYGSRQSPAGKYDAARGGHTHAQQWEVKKHGAAVPKVQGWWGHCNGWCAASALFPEPKEEVKVNGITFGVGDIKGLLSEAGMSANADFFGNRVDWGNDYNSPKFDDTVPDQFFLVLTNYMGMLKRPVLIDRYTGDQVWNQPLAGYHFEYPKPSDYLGADPSAPNVYRIAMTVRLWWMNDGVAPDIITHPFNFEESDYTGVVDGRVLKMELWVDAPIVFGADGRIQSSGNIIVTTQGDYQYGGRWRMGDGYINDGWPDYMWIPYSISRPTDPDQDYANPEIDIAWLRNHILVPGGADDPSASPRPVEPPPTPSAWPSSWPSSMPFPPHPSTGPVIITPPSGTPPNPHPPIIPTPVPIPGPSHTIPTPPPPLPGPLPNPGASGGPHIAN